MDADILDGKRTRDPNFEVDDDVKRRRTEPTGLTQLDIPASIDEAMTGVPPPIPPSDTASIPPSDDHTLTRPAYHDHPAPVSRLGLKPALPELPPSLELVTGVKTDLRARKGFVGQEEVGIIGYAGPAELKGVEGVIKQR